MTGALPVIPRLGSEVRCTCGAVMQQEEGYDLMSGWSLIFWRCTAFPEHVTCAVPLTKRLPSE